MGEERRVRSEENQGEQKEEQGGWGGRQEDEDADKEEDDEEEHYYNDDTNNTINNIQVAILRRAHRFRPALRDRQVPRGQKEEAEGLRGTGGRSGRITATVVG